MGSGLREKRKGRAGWMRESVERERRGARDELIWERVEGEKRGQAGLIEEWDECEKTSWMYWGVGREKEKGAGLD